MTDQHQISAHTDDALGRDDTVALCEALTSGERTAAELCTAAIDRIQAVNPQLNALVCERFEPALQEAKAVDERRAKGQMLPLLAGIPTLVKDNTDIAGLPTRHGSRATPSTPAAHHGEFGQQYLDTGMIALGKSSLPEFGFTCTTEFTQGPPTRNPWHSNHSTGGSSGGSAAMVASGALPIAHANDGGGSIRIPAACCGLVGMKPSRDRWRLDERLKHLPIQLVGEGVVTRSVRDTALFMAAAEQAYRYDGLPAIGHVTSPGQKRLKIAYFSDVPDGAPASAEVLEALENTAALCRQLGHQVDHIATPYDDLQGRYFFMYWAMLGFAATRLGKVGFGPEFDRNQLEPLTQHLDKHFRRNLWRLPVLFKRLKSFTDAQQQLYQQYDVLLSPTLAKPPVELGYLRLDLELEEAFERLSHYAAYTPAQNVSGAPAVSLPMAQSSAGLPIGMHFAADMGQEKLLLELALELEEAQQWASL